MAFRGQAVFNEGLKAPAGLAPHVATLKCANIVATSDVGCRLDLAKVAKALSTAEYNPEVYYALIYRPSDLGVSLP